MIKKQKKVKEIMSQLNEIWDQLAGTDFAKTDTTKFIRDERKKKI